MRNKRILMLNLVIIVFVLSTKGQGNYYVSGGREIMLTNDTTSVNIIVNNMDNYAEIVERLIILFPDSGSVKYDDEDDNIIVNSSKLLQLTKDSIIRFIQIDSNDILFFTYSKLTDSTSNKLWLRNEVLVGLKQGYDTSNISNLYSQYELLGIIDEGNNDYVIKCKTESDVLNLSNLLYVSGYVDYAHPDFYSQGILSSTINDPLYPYQFYLKNTGQYISNLNSGGGYGTLGIDINIEDAWLLEKGYSSIKVAVIDAGVNNHEDLKNSSGNSRVLSGYAPNCISDCDGSIKGSFDGIGHGECCAGIIAASHNTIGIAGIAPNISIIPIRIVKQNGDFFSNGAIAKAITKSWQDYEADIINCSWHLGTQSDKVDTAIKDCMTKGRNNKGSIVVFASGNSNDYKEVFYPANNTGVITVGAIDKNGMRYNYSCYNSTLELVTPSGSFDNFGNIRTIDLSGEEGYSSNNYFAGFGGTSAACPQVSGVAALMLSVNPNLTKNQVMSILNQTATKLSGYTFTTDYLHPDGTWNNEVGYGLVNATKAVAAAAMYGQTYEIVGETSVNVCNHYSYTLTGTIPSGCRVEWNTSFHLAIITQTSNLLIINPLVQTIGAQIIASIYVGNTLIKQIIKDDISINNSIPYYQSISNKDTVYSENTQWNENRTLGVKVYIDSGVTLTINNITTIFCSQDAKIIVRKGGKLILDGAILTNICDGKLWQGIYVDGNPNDSTQAENLQGVVELKNGAVIKNAECGINLGINKHILNGKYYYNGGGIVRATDASFINNKKAVEFGPYTRHTKRGTVTLNRNASYFRLCTFKIDNNALFSLSNFKQHVNLLEVREVTFEGCSFESINHTGSAIQSLSSGFILRDYSLGLINGIRSTISNFNTAIQIKDGGTKASSINNTNFLNNNIGILAEGTEAIYIESDSFNIPYSPYFGPTTGVSLTKCSKFEIDNNYFNGDNNCNYGLIIIKSGINSNIVEHNFFTNLSTACIAYGKNSDGINGTVGLQYYCNWFQNNNTDIYVDDYENETGTIRYIQGENNNACNNVFSTNGSSLNSMNFRFQYYYKNNNNNQTPRNISSNIDTVYKLSDKCEQIGIINPNIHVEIPGDWEITKGNEYTLINGMLTSVKNQYAGYNHINLDWEVYYNGNPVIVDSLVYYGAEISYDSTIYYDDDRPPFDTVITYRLIDSIVYYYNYIVPEDLETKVNLYFQINDLQSQLSGICQEAMYYIHSDSIIDLDIYHDWLLRDSTPEADYVLSENYYEEENYSSALNALNAVSTKYQFYDENEYTNYVNLFKVKDSLRIKNLSWDSIETSSWEMITLNSIANSGINGAALKAQAIETGYYSTTYETTYPHIPLLDLCMYIANSNSGDNNSTQNVSLTEQSNAEINLYIYPNPANDKLTVKCNNIKEIRIYDIVGKEVGKYTINNNNAEIQVSNLCPGVYFIAVKTETGTLTKRFVKE